MKHSPLIFTAHKRYHGFVYSVSEAGGRAAFKHANGICIQMNIYSAGSTSPKVLFHYAPRLNKYFAISPCTGASLFSLGVPQFHPKHNNRIQYCWAAWWIKSVSMPPICSGLGWECAERSNSTTSFNQNRRSFSSAVRLLGKGGSQDVTQPKGSDPISRCIK